MINDTRHQLTTITSTDQFQYVANLLNSVNYSQAETILRELCLHHPEQIQYFLLLGDCLHQDNKFDEALALYDSLISKYDDSAALWNNRGVTLLAMRKYSDAMISFIRALHHSPELQQPKTALATCYHALGLYEQALSCCNEAITDNPENAEAHWNKSLLLLLAGNYHQGWQEYEWRWKKERFTSPQRNFTQPLWRGETATGTTILVHAEQGYGDTLQFCRYIPLLEQLGMDVLFECHPPLVSLMKTVSPTVSVFAMGEDIPDFAIHIPLLSLPLVFNSTLENIPVSIPYLKAPEKSAIQAHSGKRLKVGLCWAGKQYPDPARSCPDHFLSELGSIEGIDWYSLQIGWNSTLPFAMHDLTSQLNDFADTAGLVSTLDLIITIDTAVAHLAGALGKTAWVMLPFIPDWRWLLDREDSPWYPAMRLYRQDLPENWLSVVHNIKQSLKMNTL